MGRAAGTVAGGAGRGEARKRNGGRLLRCGALALLLLQTRAPSPSHAQAQPQASDLATSAFNVDVVTGPVLGSHAVMGMGGAYTAMAAGMDSVAHNPAAFAARHLWALEWFEWDWAFDFIPGTLRNTDFDNNGQPGFTYRNFFFLTLGLGFQFGDLGVGGLFRFQSYAIGTNTDLTLTVGNVGLGYQFLRGQLVVGAALRTGNLRITELTTGQPLVDFAGTAPEAGVVYRPAAWPVRVGLSARMPVASEPLDDASPEDVSDSVAGLSLPAEVILPWEVQAGIAIQLGSRPLNRPWLNPHGVRDELRRQIRAQRPAPDTASSPEQLSDEEDDWVKREEARLAAIRKQEVEALSRSYVLLSADVIVIGPSPNAVGLESFLQQVRQTSGRTTSIGLRAGVTVEPWPNRIKTRLGGYLEPSRFDGVGYRPHGTLGSELRLFRWDVFGLFDPFDLRVGLTFDIADRYLNWAFGLGTWH